MTIFFPNLVIALACFWMVPYTESKIELLGPLGHLFASMFIALGLILIVQSIIAMVSGRSVGDPMNDMMEDYE